MNVNCVGIGPADDNNEDAEIADEALREAGAVWGRTVGRTSLGETTVNQKKSLEKAKCPHLSSGSNI